MRLDIIECSIPLLIYKIRQKTITEEEIERLQDTLQTLIKAARISTDEIKLLPYRSNNIISMDTWKNLHQ